MSTVEGDYNTWTEIWEQNTGITMDDWPGRGSHSTWDETKMFVRSNDDVLVFNCATGAYTRYTERSGAGVDVYRELAHKTYNHRYFVTVDTNWAKFYIFKDGVPIEEHDVETPGDLFQGILISWKGKYILTLTEEQGTPDVYVWRGWEGSLT